jgi:hypothetical protein
MGIEDLAGKAEEFLKSDQVKDALGSSQAEDISDTLLDGVEDVVNKVTGGKFEGALDGARDAADKAVGDR